MYDRKLWVPRLMAVIHLNSTTTLVQPRCYLRLKPLALSLGFFEDVRSACLHPFDIETHVGIVRFEKPGLAPCGQ